jgi:hypothetical protein
MRQNKEQVMDKRAIAGMVTFLGLTAGLALAVPFTLERAQTNYPLTQAIKGLLN